MEATGVTEQAIQHTKEKAPVNNTEKSPPALSSKTESGKSFMQRLIERHKTIAELSVARQHLAEIAKHHKRKLAVQTVGAVMRLSSLADDFGMPLSHVFQPSTEPKTEQVGKVEEGIMPSHLDKGLVVDSKAVVSKGPPHKA